MNDGAAVPNTVYMRLGLGYIIFWPRLFFAFIEGGDLSYIASCDEFMERPY